MARHPGLKPWNEGMNAGHHRDDLLQHRMNAKNYRDDLLQHRMNAKNYRDDLLQHRMNAKNYCNDLLQHRMNAKNYRDDLLQHRMNATSYCNDLSEQGNDGPYPNYLIGCPNMAAKKRGVCPKMGFWRQAKNVNRPCKPVIRPCKPVNGIIVEKIWKGLQRFTAREEEFENSEIREFGNRRDSGI